MSSGGKQVYVGESNRRILAGEEDVSEWDDEELWAGRRRDRGGSFRGRGPTLVPTSVHRELNRRKFATQAFEVLSDAVVDAVQHWVDIVRDPDADPQLRMRAAENIADRVLGKPETRSQVEVSIGPAPWQNALGISLVGTEAQAADVIDAEVIEDDAEDVRWET